MPNYLEKIKSNIMNEYTMIQEMHRQEQEEQEKQKFNRVLAFFLSFCEQVPAGPGGRRPAQRGTQEEVGVC